MPRIPMPSSLLTRWPRASALALACAALSGAAPITTVPWNGYAGAVSFTYDDARASQLPNLLPQLDSLGLKATFYIAIQNVGTFNARRADWIQVARDGHELTNHTYKHENVHQIGADSVTKVIKAMADTLRGLDTAIQSVTFAYPNCNVPANAAAKAGISAENFIARGCGGATYAWGTQPADWMNVQGLIMQPSNQSAGINALNTAKNQNRWATLVIHDVADPTPDVYSITPANNLQLLTTAVANGSWVAPFETVGAYYRAHFTLDTASAVRDGNSWKVEWTSPHARMPRRVPVRIQLDSAVFGDSAVVMQGGVASPLQADGSYVIDFMKLRLDVHPKGTASLASATRLNRFNVRTSGGEVRLNGLSPDVYAYTVRAVTGRVLQRGNLHVSGNGEHTINVPALSSSGLYQLTLRASSGATHNLSVLTSP